MLLFLITVVLLAFSPLSASTIRVSWDANTETDLAGYKVYYGTTPTPSQGVDVGKVLTYDITNITPAVGTNYYVAVTAYDTSGNESVLSNVSVVFVPDSVAPAKPTGIKAIIIKLIAWLERLFS